MRELLTILSAILVVSLLGWGGYVLLFGSGKDAGLIIRETAGTVDYIDANGATFPASVGQAVEAKARLRSGEDGRAVLEFGTDSTVTLAESTSIRVMGFDSDAVRIELDDGRVEATVRPGRSLGVVSGDREVRAEDGRFRVASGQSGLVVEVDEGAVNTSGLEGVSGLVVGERLFVAPSGEVAVAPIPRAMTFEVAWPENVSTREAEISVRGRTDPGAEVRLHSLGAWRTIVADPSGNFEMVVPLEEGTNPLRVISRDPMGRESEETHEVIRDSRPPNGAAFEVHY